MDRFYLMSVFVAVAEEESFAGAARRLNMSPPAVTRAIAALEERLGVKLLNRTTRFVRATDAGLRYLEDARRIMADADEADEAAAGVNAAPRGHLALTAPVLFGRMFVTPTMVDYLRRFPGMSVSALFLDRVVNLLEEGMDVGIRIGELPDSTMKAIKVGHVRRVVCAAPAYLAEHGVPASPDQLVQHAVIVSTGISTAEWRFGAGSKTSSVKLKPRLTVTSNDAAIEAALQGFGVTRLLSYQIAAHLDSGQLQAVLGSYEPPPLPIHVLHREGRQAAAKVRTFVDLLADKLRAEPALR
ncbi:LysR family transcriptional regulator [Paraherbaspirillum soli]|uniref:LysR family transcriptional regulator n=1 Tax=Paraherbaspirillum soli TaxID=631222 RepID=A0ABW0M5T0_9BURK